MKMYKIFDIRPMSTSVFFHCYYLNYHYKRISSEHVTKSIRIIDNLIV